MLASTTCIYARVSETRSAENVTVMLYDAMNATAPCNDIYTHAGAMPSAFEVTDNDFFALPGEYIEFLPSAWLQLKARMLLRLASYCTSSSMLLPRRRRAKYRRFI